MIEKTTPLDDSTETAGFIDWTNRLLVVFVGALYFDMDNFALRVRLTQDLFDFWKQSKSLEEDA